MGLTLADFKVPRPPNIDLFSKSGAHSAMSFWIKPFFKKACRILKAEP